MPRLVNTMPFCTRLAIPDLVLRGLLPRAGLQALAGFTKPFSGWLHQTWPRRSLPRVGDTIPWRVRLVPRPFTRPLWCTFRLPLLHGSSWAPHPASNRTKPLNVTQAPKITPKKSRHGALNPLSSFRKGKHSSHRWPLTTLEAQSISMLLKQGQRKTFCEQVCGVFRTNTPANAEISLRD